MKREALYFEFWFPIEREQQIWMAQPEDKNASGLGERWKVISPESQQLGNIYHGGNAFFASSDLLGIHSVQRQTVEAAVYVIAQAFHRQQELKRRMEK